MKILNYPEIDPLKWEQLSLESPVASYFQTKSCYDFYSTLSFLKPFVWAVEENGMLVSLVCGYTIANGSLLKRFFSRRAIIPGGLLLSDNCSNQAITILLEHVKHELYKKAIYIEIRNYSDYSKHSASLEKSGFTYNKHLNFRVATPTVETALMGLSKSKRRQIKQSEMAGARIELAQTNEDMDAYYQILLDLYKTKIKLPLFPIDFFYSLREQHSSKIFIIKYNSTIIGGITCVILNKKVAYEWFVCGDDSAHKNVYPSVLATWAGIKYAAENGFEYFDFMGAGKPEEEYGVREFKSKFGGELVEHGRYLQTIKPLLFSIGKCAVKLLKK